MSKMNVIAGNASVGQWKSYDWNVINAMDKVMGEMREKGIDTKWSDATLDAAGFLMATLSLNFGQVVLLSIMTELGSGITWHSIARNMKSSRLNALSYSSDMAELVKSGWVIKNKRDVDNPSYSLAIGVTDALCNNKPFIPENLEGLDAKGIINKFHRLASDRFHSHKSTEELQEWILQVCEANPQLRMSKEVIKMKYDMQSVLLLFMLMRDFMMVGGSPREGIQIGQLEHFFEDDDLSEMFVELEDGSHFLFEEGLIEYKCQEGIACKDTLVITRKCREELMEGMKPRFRSGGKNVTGLISATGIARKEMFYNIAEQKQLDRLAGLLDREQFAQVQERLQARGFRKGFACLFHGGPGTGKTETVLQLARRTGRDVMQVDIAGIKDKFVGESEKNIKDVFARYRSLCKESEVTPILFFNEADALINKRNEDSVRSVDKMENAMQNIILQELENLDGILIATTNLTSNLDDAFERRFIFKIKFDQPSIEVKAKIWRTMMDNELSSDEAMLLASKYDLSGGQIENIARKRAVDIIINGCEPSFDELDLYCQQESLHENASKRRVIVGF